MSKLELIFVNEGRNANNVTNANNADNASNEVMQKTWCLPGRI